MARERLIHGFDGTELYTQSAGAGPPIVLADGIGCDGFVWRVLEDILVRKHQVVRWHHRGHGKSQVPENRGNLGMDALCLDLQAVLDAYDLDQALLVGHSMGVQLILEYAIREPRRVSGLVPICGSYGRMLDTFHDNGLASAGFPQLYRLVADYPDWAQWLWSRLLPTEAVYLYAVTTEVKGSLVRRQDFKPYFDHLARMDVRVFFEMLERVRHHTVEDRLQQVQAPTLVVAGDRDTFTPVWLSRRMQRLIPGAELLVVPHGSHAAPLEMPELIELRLQRFLKERVLPRQRAATATGRGRRPQSGRRRRAPKR